MVVPLRVVLVLLVPEGQRREKIARLILGQVDPDLTQRLAGRSFDPWHVDSISDSDAAVLR